MTPPSTFTAFVGLRSVAEGSIRDIADALATSRTDTPPLIFEDATGAPVELDLRHGAAAAVEDYAQRTAQADREAPPSRQGRGRPRLGVVAREVTLLPKHWDWLAAQPGGASAALRRLVDEASRIAAPADRLRQARDATYRVMSALAGDLPGFEAASRALFRGDWEAFDTALSSWPSDVGDYIGRLAAAARPGSTA